MEGGRPPEPDPDTWAALSYTCDASGRRISQEETPFAGSTRFQHGYDERMPTHLLARMEAIRDVGCVRSSEYARRYRIPLPEDLT